MRIYCYRCNYPRLYEEEGEAMALDLERRGWNHDEGGYICKACTELRRLDIEELKRKGE